MKKHVIFSFVAVLAVLTLIVSCSDRHTNVPVAPGDGRYAVGLIDHVFADSTTNSPHQLLFQIKNTYAQMHMTAVWPDSTVTQIPDQYRGKKWPLVVLLAPQDEDQYFYLSHGLQQLSNEMVANGTIRPMLIVTVPNDKVFGGYFYGNSDPAGRYDEVIGDRLIKYLENAYNGMLYGDSLHRGIGGVGQGGYGAFRAALKHPGAFKAIAVTDGPLDFDGDANNGTGLLPLFSQAMAEQNLTPATYRRFGSPFEVDNTGFGVLTPISRMFVGGSLAFSPHITDVYDSILLASTSATYWLKKKDTISDVGTLIASCIDGQELQAATWVKPGIGAINWDFHLPFDSNAQVYAPIWNNYWIPNNLESILNANTPGSLSHVNMWFGTTPDAQYGFHGMTEAWIATLKAKGYSDQMTEENYSGYPGNPATTDQYVYDLMREMLIFYSNNLGN
jgi:hypothetical protein